MSEEVKRIVLEIANEDGWFAERDQEIIAVTVRETARKTAKKMLELGYPVEEISIITKLPVEEVKELA